MKKRAKRIMLAVIDWFRDSKSGAVISTFVIVAIVGFGGPSAVNALSDVNASGYTGSAKIVSHKATGSFCKIIAEQNNGIQDEMLYGPKRSCESVEVGMIINIDRGRILHQQ